ncbi:BolA family protein [Legionella fairfieldensis]|uniref:BolA family protein n=1 Tax=Legionella fairfieldensis TaxID=45064 RepID=UPI001F5FB9FF|nr:BolA/IbaG family iron-sulfur metabolism protein [Legionella fairfieldensis]
MMSREHRINQLITENLQPSVLKTVNESNRHHVPEGSETHFKLIIVSDKFKNTTKINRHRLINKLLATELNTGLHALSLYLYTGEEWHKLKNNLPESPACRGGYEE